MRFSPFGFDMHFSKDDIENILCNAKTKNKKYIYQILRIRNITVFEAGYIMNRLDLTSDKIRLLNLTLMQYEKRPEIFACESYSDFLFRIVRNMEKLDNEMSEAEKDMAEIRISIDNFSKYVEYLISNSIFMQKKQRQGYVFSTVYFDK